MSLAEARRVVIRRGLLLQLFVFRMELERALEEKRLFFAMIRIRQAALDGAHGLTRLVIVEADALGAELRVDDVNLVPFADGFVGTLRLARAAVDAIRGDVRR